MSFTEERDNGLLNAYSCSGCANGNGLSSTALSTENNAVLAPIPMARESTTTAANPGLFHKPRAAYRRFLQESADPRSGTYIADLFLHLLDAAKLDFCRAQRLVRRHAGARLFFRQGLDIEPELVVQVPFFPLSMKWIEEKLPHLRHPFQMVSSAWAMATATRSQRIFSASSCRRPALVRR